ncbi:HAD family hydrolase [Methylosinus sp. H3A]|uniref:HAD family hydrolase n=1 Tax=Methylosinus sp. H3A TaxID=2785786 RepID=UPI0018C20804|nr:HAD family hydrolase [Methylosinus sp. H3A]MBG0810928.1 HAD family hydrolase [Methylosinus sp. H3A]
MTAGFEKEHRTLVVFDIDGTLIQSMALDGECYGAALFEHFDATDISLDWTTYEHASDPGVVTELYARRIGRAPTAQELRDFQHRFVSRLEAAMSDREPLQETPGASRLLSALAADARFEVVIATGAWREPISMKLAAAGVDIGGFPFACGDDAIERARIFSLAVERAAGSFERIVLVGDGVWDIVTARALGFSFLGVGSGAEAERLREEGAEHVVEDFSRLDAVVELLTRV